DEKGGRNAASVERMGGRPPSRREGSEQRRTAGQIRPRGRGTSCHLGCLAGPGCRHRRMDKRAVAGRLSDSGLTSVQFVLAAGLSLLLFVGLANLVVVQYGRGAIRSALEQGVRTGSVTRSTDACQETAAGVASQLLGGAMSDRLVIACSTVGGGMVANADAVFQAWVPLTPDFVVPSAWRAFSSPSDERSWSRRPRARARCRAAHAPGRDRGARVRPVVGAERPGRGCGRGRSQGGGDRSRPATGRGSGRQDGRRPRPGDGSCPRWLVRRPTGVHRGRDGHLQPRAWVPGHPRGGDLGASGRDPLGIGGRPVALGRPQRADRPVPEPPVSRERGTITMWMLGLSLLLLAFGGLAIDYWRALAYQRELAAIAD